MDGYFSGQITGYPEGHGLVYFLKVRIPEIPQRFGESQTSRLQCWLSFVLCGSMWRIWYSHDAEEKNRLVGNATVDLHSAVGFSISERTCKDLSYARGNTVITCYLPSFAILLTKFCRFYASCCLHANRSLSESHFCHCIGNYILWQGLSFTPEFDM